MEKGQVWVVAGKAASSEELEGWGTYNQPKHALRLLPPLYSIRQAATLTLGPHSLLIPLAFQPLLDTTGLSNP